MVCGHGLVCCGGAVVHFGGFFFFLYATTLFLEVGVLYSELFSNSSCTYKDTDTQQNM